MIGQTNRLDTKQKRYMPNKTMKRKLKAKNQQNFIHIQMKSDQTFRTNLCSQRQKLETIIRQNNWYNILNTVTQAVHSF